jgi:hypothetical protein
MTRGGSEVKQLKDSEAWKASIARLLPLISTGEVEIVGRPGAGGPAEPIKGHIFLGIVIPTPLETPFSVITGADPWICCSAYIDEPHWQTHFNDHLFLNRPGPPAWTHLSVKRSDVLRHVRFDTGEQAKVPTYETGAPGRPTSIQLVRAEYLSRRSKGLSLRTITEEAAALSKWLRQTHPDAPQLKPKTIKNNLASDFRATRARK